MSDCCVTITVQYPYNVAFVLKGKYDICNKTI